MCVFECTTGHLCLCVCVCVFKCTIGHVCVFPDTHHRSTYEEAGHPAGRKTKPGVQRIPPISYIPRPPTFSQKRGGGRCTHSVLPNRLVLVLVIWCLFDWPIDKCKRHSNMIKPGRGVQRSHQPCIFPDLPLFFFRKMGIFGWKCWKNLYGLGLNTNDPLSHATEN